MYKWHFLYFCAGVSGFILTTGCFSHLYFYHDYALFLKIVNDLRVKMKNIIINLMQGTLRNKLLILFLFYKKNEKLEIKSLKIRQQ